ncbi:D-amino acid dehydrogenase [Pyruvatibacter mobilis]|uniref:D-amino acid dehydrogenase n=1 Tax=Pyruvatibacter mobilis TaxID=1712261 RepID=UPI003D148844
MKIVVLGAGVVGVTTAYYLAERGHEVTVIDRAEGPALETSFANGGQVSASGSAPWAAPGVPWQGLKWLGRADAPLRWKPRLDPAQWSWLMAFLRRCTAKAYDAGVTRNLTLGRLSVTELRLLRARLGLDYHQRTKGILKIAKSDADLADLRDKAAKLTAKGAQVRFVDAAECAAIEPALEPAVAAGEVRGGIHFLDDESGDAHLFTEQVAAAAEEAGVTFRYGTAVEALETAGKAVTGIRTSSGPVACDHVVVCLGVGSRALLRPLGIRLPVYPVKGYSVTVDLDGSNIAPAVSLTDEERRVVVSRFGTQLRVAGMAELAGNDLTIDPARARAVRQALDDLFPGLARLPDARVWTGLRPMTPDGGAIIGAAPPWANLTLNTGHGTYGWTMACGSARLVADLVSGETPPLDMGLVSLARFR